MNPVRETTDLFIEAWKFMVGRLPSSRILEEENVVSCAGHVPLPFLNVAFQNAPAESVEAFRGVLADAARQMADCHFPAFVAVREDWLPAGWESVAAEAGKASAMGLTGMETDAVLPARRPAPPLELRRVVDDGTARDIAMLNADAYGVPGELFECMCNTHIWREDTHGFVGYLDGQPVTSAAAFPVAGTVYVALVASQPALQGRGYAETVMRHAIAEAQRATGLPRVTLHATDAGRPLYANMGFLPSARFHLLAGEH